MSRFIKRIFILWALCASPFYAYGCVPEDEGRLVSVATADLPKDVHLMVLTLAAEDPATNPGNFRLVCKSWRDAVGNRENLTYANLNKIWQRIFRLSYMGFEYEEICQRFVNARLRERGGEERFLSVSSFQNPFHGTFDLSVLDGQKSRGPLLITTDPHLYSLVVDNMCIDKVILGIFLFNTFQKYFGNMFSELTKDYNPKAAPVVMIWRRASWSDLSWGNILLNQSPESISSKSLKILADLSVQHGRSSHYDLFSYWVEIELAWLKFELGGLPLILRNTHGF